MDVILIVLVGASLLLSLYTGFRLFMVLTRIRRESQKGFEIASRVVEDWERFASEEGEKRRRMDERFEEFEASVRARVEESEKIANGARERLTRLEQYLKEFFEVELKTVFESFDKTVASILEEMKAELLRGVDRIEEIQAVVDSKSLAQDRILDGEGSMYRLLTENNGSDSQRRDEEGGAGETATEKSDQPRLNVEGDEGG